MPKVFISYAREDQAAAELIAHRFRGTGSLVTGGSWSQQLGLALNESIAVVVLLSTNARKAPWVKSEVQAALENKKVVVPVFLDDGAKDNWLWPLLANRQSLRLYAHGPDVSQQLDAIASVIRDAARPPHTITRRRLLALITAVTLVGSSGAVFWYRATKQAELERQRRVAAEEEQMRLAEQQARLAQELQDTIRLQTESERALAEGAQLAAKGRISDAIDLYNQAIKLNPASAVAHQLLGYAYLRRAQLKPNSQPSDPGNAVQSLERALDLDPQYIWSAYNLALAYWQIGRQQDAIASVKRVLEIDPEFRSIIAADGQFARFRQSSEFRALLQDQ
jgi:tetratricopeptide (TPR) repeat protein